MDPWVGVTTSWLSLNSGAVCAVRIRTECGRPSQQAGRALGRSVYDWRACSALSLAEQMRHSISGLRVQELGNGSRSYQCKRDLAVNFKPFGRAAFSWCISSWWDYDLAARSSTPSRSDTPRLLPMATSSHVGGMQSRHAPNQVIRDPRDFQRIWMAAMVTCKALLPLRPLSIMTYDDECRDTEGEAGGRERALSPTDAIGAWLAYRQPTSDVLGQDTGSREVTCSSLGRAGPPTFANDGNCPRTAGPCVGKRERPTRRILPSTLIMQTDGNLVMYKRRAAGPHTAGCPRRLVVQNDGNLVIYHVPPKGEPVQNHPRPRGELPVVDKAVAVAGYGERLALEKCSLPKHKYLVVASSRTSTSIKGRRSAGLELPVVLRGTGALARHQAATRPRAATDGKATARIKRVGRGTGNRAYRMSR